MKLKKGYIYKTTGNHEIVVLSVDKFGNSKVASARSVDYFVGFKRRNQFYFVETLERLLSVKVLTLHKIDAFDLSMDEFKPRRKRNDSFWSTDSFILWSRGEWTPLLETGVPYTEDSRGIVSATITESVLSKAA